MLMAESLPVVSVMVGVETLLPLVELSSLVSASVEDLERTSVACSVARSASPASLAGRVSDHSLEQVEMIHEHLPV
jgi:hypothetical protein